MKPTNDIRLNVKIVNNTTPKEPIQCKKILCESVEGLKINDIIQPDKSLEFTSTSNDRIFCEFVGLDEKVYEMAFTSPRSSTNSACGFVHSGLQCYAKHDTPVSFVFHVGAKNLADWDNGCEYKGVEIEFGSCS